MQKQHTIGIDHGGVGCFAMCLPDRAAVKILKRLRARRHVPKTSQPDKSVWIIHVPELTDDLHPERFLRFDKFPVEQIDQHIPLPRMQRVLPQLNDRAASLSGCATGFSIAKPCAANGIGAIRNFNARKINMLGSMHDSTTVVNRL
jgi:hypothetical protein